MAIKNTEDIKRLGSILCVFAHPDDETFTAAGILAAAVKNGQQVVCITATKGEEGVQDESRWPKESLAETRKSELEQALNLIGVKEHHWLDYQDGKCISADEEKAVSKVAQLVEKYQPDTVLTFGKDGYTGHDDHKTVGVWAKKACSKCSKTPQVYCVAQPRELYDKYLKSLDDKHNIFFNIDKPNLVSEQESDIYFELDEGLKQLKLETLKVMPSQTENLLSSSNITDAFSIEAFVKA